MIFHVCISSPRWPSGLRHPLFMQRVVGLIPAIVDAISFTFLPQSGRYSHFSYFPNIVRLSGDDIDLQLFQNIFNVCCDLLIISFC